MSVVSTEFDTPELRRHSILRHVHKMLHRWKGKQFRLYNLTMNHRCISIRLSDNRYHLELPYLQIACIEPVYMRGYFDADTNDLEIREENGEYTVYDRNGGFELVCGKIEIAEREGD